MRDVPPVPEVLVRLGPLNEDRLFTNWCMPKTSASWCIGQEHQNGSG